ncbi:MAG: hypothetical protein M5U19_20110 [Microthrixaceae bacterium]|nr:hypothetical protein [Microthrixaceae bacterium]
MIGYNHEQGGYRPFHLMEELGPNDCIHGQKGCNELHPGMSPLRHLGGPGGRPPLRPHPHQAEVAGIYHDILLTRASEQTVLEQGRTAGSCRRS